jgi:hypothetical protein
MTESRDIISEIKEKIRLEDIVGEDYPHIPTSGRERKVPHTGGLVVNVEKQLWHWFTNNSGGDVFEYLKTQRGMDFKTAAEYLARKAGLPEPEWHTNNMQVRVAARKREDALTVAMKVFQAWFWKSDAAQEYVKKRGWSIQRGGEDTLPGTAQLAMLGYSGHGTSAEREEMRRVMMSEGVDLASPAAVAILGYKGDVRNWAKAHEVDAEKIKEEWIKKGEIPGLMGRNALIYPHEFAGRVQFLSSRSLSLDPKQKFHYNLPSVLIGEKRTYINHAYTYDAAFVVIVEGQADAISLAQWGVAAIALCGAHLDDQTLQDLKNRHRAIYIGLDADDAGVFAAWTMGFELGPKTYILPPADLSGRTFPIEPSMPKPTKEKVELANQVLFAINRAFDDYPIPKSDYLPEDKEKQVKDLNDLLQGMNQHEVPEDRQIDNIRKLIQAAPTFAEVSSAWAGAREGYEREEAFDKVMLMITQLDDVEIAHHRTRLAHLLNLNMREFDRLLKTYRKEAENDKSEGEPEDTFGGFVDGYLIEYLYDSKTKKAMLAWRTPEGVIESGYSLVIGTKKYVPSDPTESMLNGSVLFPSKLGEKKTVQQLTEILDMYIKSVGLLPSESTRKLISYWLINTWVYDCFSATSYLTFMGETGAGKSELMFRIGMCTYRPMSLSGASSVSSFFRMVNKYKGTVMIDEGDLQKSDTTQDVIKFYNQGAMKGRPITKMVDVVLPDGRHDYQEVAFQTYCPKMNTLKKLMYDDAVTSRSIVIKLQPRETIELVKAGIPLNINEDIRNRAQAVRNLLVRYRMEKWQEEIEVNNSYYDLTISARMNQIAGSLLMMAEDEPEQQEMIKENLREYYRESQISKSMTLEARVIEALWTIYTFMKDFVVYMDGVECIRTGKVADVANQIINRMNSADGEADSDDEDDESEDQNSRYKKKSKPKAMTAHKVGQMVRNSIQLETTKRKADGFYIKFDPIRLEGLAMRYGVDIDSLEPIVTVDPLIDPEKSKKALNDRLEDDRKKKKDQDKKDEDEDEDKKDEGTQDKLL